MLLRGGGLGVDRGRGGGCGMGCAGREGTLDQKKKKKKEGASFAVLSQSLWEVGRRATERWRSLRPPLTHGNVLPPLPCVVISCEGRSGAKRVNGGHIGLRGLTWQRGASYSVARCGQVRRGSGGGYAVPVSVVWRRATSAAPPQLHSAQHATRRP